MEIREWELDEIPLRSTGAPGLNFVWQHKTCRATSFEFSSTTFAGDITARQQRPRSLSSGAPRALSSRSLRTPAPTEARGADLPPHVALFQTRVWEDTRGNSPLPGAPCVPRRQRSLGGAGGSGVRTDPALLVSHQCQIWEIAVFSLLANNPEVQRGGEVRGERCHSAERPGGPGHSGRADRGRGSAVPVRQLPPPRGLGRAESRPCGSALDIIYEVLEAAWGELYFYLHIKDYRCP